MSGHVHFTNPISGINDASASGLGSPGWRYRSQERFCMLGWHWVHEDHRDNVIRTVLEEPLGSDTLVQACQSCMRHWHATGRVHVGTLTNEAAFWHSDFRPRHRQRISRWWWGGSPLLRDEKTKEKR